MPGKGRKRREKNYRAAHGAFSTLPPPPKSSQLDRLPSKLRQIMSFTQHPNGPAGVSKDKKRNDGHDQDNIAITGNVDVEIAQVKQRDTGEQLKAPQDTDEQLNASSGDDKKKKKRKRKEVKDLRFAMEEDKTSSQLKKRERKKKYLEKKKKHKKGHEEEENFDFPGQEKIKFGDIVQAPPKFSVTPKAFKNAAHDASHERLRLRAIEEYRSRKAWTSRPGSHRPPPVTSSDT